MVDLDRIYALYARPGRTDEQVVDSMSYGLYSFAGIRPREKAVQMVREYMEQREYRLFIRDALEQGRHSGASGEGLIDFAAYVIRRDGVMSKEKSEQLVREYMRQEG